MTAAPELDDADKALLITLLHQVIAADPVPLSSRVNRPRAILGKLEPPMAQPPPYPRPKLLTSGSHAEEGNHVRAATVPRDPCAGGMPWPELRTL
jgi:hypothetical protein